MHVRIALLTTDALVYVLVVHTQKLRLFNKNYELKQCARSLQCCQCISNDGNRASVNTCAFWNALPAKAGALIVKMQANLLQF